MLFRIRLTSFLAGFAVAGGLALYQLQHDVKKSHAIIAGEVESFKTDFKTLSVRLSKLEQADLAPPTPPSETAEKAG
ncbi:hypothetical protein BSKO_05187 [Bryopsis sp. KO-2023]|nr:hypothetical protein BSKO_05187 [Bryopsis sp. KO-2023]